jgi:hypothetical protein
MADRFFYVRAQKVMELPPLLLVEDDKNDLLLVRHAFSDAEVKNILLVAENVEVAAELLTKDQNSATPGVRILITDRVKTLGERPQSTTAF